MLFAQLIMGIAEIKAIWVDRGPIRDEESADGRKWDGLDIRIGRWGGVANSHRKDKAEFSDVANSYRRRMIEGAGRGCSIWLYKGYWAMSRSGAARAKCECCGGARGIPRRI